jgi:hypothetical protein
VALDDYVQVAPDSSGKLVDMELVTTAAGAAVRRQRAAIVGDTADALLEIRLLLRNLIAIESAILATLQAETNSQIGPDDFPPA